MSYFSQSKGARDTRTPENTAVAPKLDVSAPMRKPAQEMVSTLGPGLMVTGNIVSTGAVQIYGRVVGDIHAERLLISKGAQVEGKVMALEAVIEGEFSGTIHSNNVKLQATAVVDGEIYKQSLVIEQNAQFEGVARRLTTPIEAPTDEQIKSQAAAPLASLVPEPQAVNPTYDGKAQMNQPYGLQGGSSTNPSGSINNGSTP